MGLTPAEVRIAKISPTNVMGNIKFHGLYVPTLEAMYGLLDQDLSDNMPKRVFTILEAVRRSHG